MRNTLSDLNNYLFEALERINDDENDEEQFEREIKRAEATTKVANVIINNANTQLRAVKCMEEYGYNTKGVKLIPETFVIKENELEKK